MHTVGPVGEYPEMLESCYSTCLDLVEKHGIKSVAFCGISTGIFGYPLFPASRIAIETVRKWLESGEKKNVERIIFCTFLAKEKDCYEKLMPIYFPVSKQEEKEEKNVEQQQQEQAKVVEQEQEKVKAEAEEEARKKKEQEEAKKQLEVEEAKKKKQAEEDEKKRLEQEAALKKKQEQEAQQKRQQAEQPQQEGKYYFSFSLY